jgi:hypothetical protein
MSLNDVWRNLNDELGIYWKGRFDRVPAGPGVYAWFYPLRISSLSIEDFLSDVAAVFSFDARVDGPARLSHAERIGWDRVNIELEMNPANPPLPESVLKTWHQTTSDLESFERLRRMVMKGSLLMPPLYVGKARSLSVRCQQHLGGGGHHDFNRRFTSYAEQFHLGTTRVEDLLFVCVKTGADERASDDGALEDVLEEILKRACRPRYSFR